MRHDGSRAEGLEGRYPGGAHEKDGVVMKGVAYEVHNAVRTRRVFVSPSHLGRPWAAQLCEPQQQSSVLISCGGGWIRLLY